MASTAIISQGTTFYRMGSSAFEEVVNVKTFSFGGQANMIDITNLSSTSKEKAAGVRDNGQLSLNIHYNPGDTIHSGLQADSLARSRRQFKMEFPSPVNKAWTFYGYVTQFTTQGGVDAPIEANVSIEVDGDFTEITL